MEEKSLEAIVSEPNNSRDAIMLALKSPSGERTTWVIVEAEDDYTVYSKFMHPDTTTVKTSRDIDGKMGYSHVEKIVEDIKKEVSYAHIVGIRDADYTRYEDTEHIFPQNIFITDHRDLEMMMISSESVQHELRHWAAGYEQAKELCLNVCRHFGYLHIFNHVKQLYCTFHNNVEINKCWDDNSHSLKPDWKEECTSKFLSSISTDVTEDDLEDFIKNKNLEQEDFLDICRGHDYLSILSKTLIHTNIFSPKTIMSHMSTSYSYDDFIQTRLYADIKSWQEKENVTALAS